MLLTAVTGLLAAAAVASPATAEESGAAFDEAIHCAALETFMGALLSSTGRGRPEIETGLRRASIRWLEYAATLPPEDPVRVMDAYLDYSSKHYDPILQQPGGDEAEIRGRLGAELSACSEAERHVFGSTYRELGS